MAIENTSYNNFEVEITNKTIVKAPGPSPGPHIIQLSNLDLLSGRFPVTYIYFYSQNPQSFSIDTTLKDSLAKCLGHFYPFAGSISDSKISHEPEITCDNTGALVIEATARISLKDLDFYNLNQSLIGKLIPLELDHFPVQVQITDFACGGLSMTFTFDHALGDASAFGKFLLTWSEIASGKPICCSPDHGRELRARDPPRYEPSLDAEFISWIDAVEERSRARWALPRDIIGPKLSCDRIGLWVWEPSAGNSVLVYRKTRSRVHESKKERKKGRVMDGLSNLVARDGRGP